MRLDPIENRVTAQALEILALVSQNGAVVAGGYPLWLIDHNSVDTAKDMDIFCFDNKSFAKMAQDLGHFASVVETDNALTLLSPDRELVVQVVRPRYGVGHVQELINSFDISASQLYCNPDASVEVTGEVERDIARRRLRFVRFDEPFHTTYKRFKRYVAKGFIPEMDEINHLAALHKNRTSDYSESWY